MELKYNEHHCHTHFSTGDCIIKIPALVKKALEYKSQSITITDHGSLGAIYELIKECRGKPIKPIIGIEAYFVDDLEDQASSIPYNYAHIILLVRNEEGWKNLKEMHSQAWSRGFLKKPRIDLKMLQDYHKGLICLTACARGLIGWNYIQEMDKFYKDEDVRKKLVRKRIGIMKDLFGDDLYYELQLNDMEIQRKLNSYTIRLCEKMNGKLIICGDCHYINKTDYHEHDIMICYSRKKVLSDPESGIYPTHEVYFKNINKVLNSWQAYHDDYMSEDDFNDGLKSTIEITEKVELFGIKPNKVCLPEFCENPHDEFNKLIFDGWEKKLTQQQKHSLEYRQRLEYEKDVISKLKMESYMLVCADIIKNAKNNFIPVGPGRGSVCGSLVAYLMDITQIDPIRFNIIFERFLTAERLSLPDIDMDFGRDGREKVKDSVKEKYGEDKFAAIITYQDWKPRNLIKDIGKVLGRDFQEMNTITKKIHDKTTKFKDEEYPMNTEALTWLEDNLDIFEPAKKLEGIYRAKGVHASGMILTPTKLEDCVPVAYTIETSSEERKPVKVSEWDMYALEDLNILKIDFLGLQTLDVIEMCVHRVNKKYQTTTFILEEDKKIKNIWDTCLADLENPEVYKTICEGKIIGMFQLETSEGMAELVKKMQPKCFYDIVMLISLYRTAIIKAGMTEEYINRRNGADFEYIHPSIKPILKDTFGILVFQEQLMEIAVVAGGMTKSESDNFRKATKLKDLEKFKVWENRFIEGCAKNKIESKKAKELWDWCVKWSGYGFNISHATAYALITYVTAWLKTHYPIEYMASLMSYNAGDKDMMPKYVTECKKMKIKIKRPRINLSSDKFVIDKDSIIQPLTVINNVGEKAISAIFTTRSEEKFKSLDDFLNRIDLRVCNVRVVVNLILAGAFNKLEDKTTEQIYDSYIEGRIDKKVFRQYYCPDCKHRFPCVMKVEEVEQMVCNNCGCSDISMDFSSKEARESIFHKVYIQNQVYGFAVVDNPLKRYVDVIAKYDAEYLAALDTYDEDVMVALAAYVKNIKEWKDKKGNVMAFIDLSDGEFECSMTVFASDWEKVKKEITKGCCYIFAAKKNRGNNLLYVGRGPIKSRLVKLGL